MAAYIRKIKDGSDTIYPITDSKAVYYNADETLSSTLDVIQRPFNFK